jgi:hypothetical protein
MSGERDPDGARDRDVMRASSQFLGHGMALAASVALFGWVGFEIGERIGAESLLTLTGMFIGGAAGFYSLYLKLVIRPRLEQGDEENDED